MAAPVRTKIDLSQLDSSPGTGRPVLKLVPPLIGQPEPSPAKPSPPSLRPKRSRDGRHRAKTRVATCTPVVRKRRRVAASVLIGLVFFLGVVGVGMLASSMTGGAVPDRTAVVWVQPGETLWDVAERSAPGYDTEAVMARIRELNEIPANGVLGGQALQVPSAP
jgi:hypothetical protein